MWAAGHARRKFDEAVKVNRDDGPAIQMVRRMDALFLVDRDARKRQMSVEERLASRQEHAQAWAEEIRQECAKLAPTVLPKSALGKAVAYTLNMWPKLRRCFDYAEVELSNNLAENSMRPVVLGRKNWLHVGSAKAGPKVAAIISVVESCRRLGLPLKDYLLETLSGLDRRKLSELSQLTPSRCSGSGLIHPGLAIRIPLSYARSLVFSGLLWPAQPKKHRSELLRQSTGQPPPTELASSHSSRFLGSA